VAVLVSRCLTGTPCRFDGQGRPAAALRLLPRHWICLDLCPEVDLGMGVPRPPVGLLAAAERVRLVERNGDREWTGEMESWCAFMARILLRDGVAGAVLKARSPSCGVADAEVFADRARTAWPGPPDAVLRRDADGLWTAALRALDASFPIVSDEELADPVRAADFVRRVEERHRRRPAARQA